MDAGHDVTALDVNPGYVRRSCQLGVDARLFDGLTIPLPDASVDTVFMIEVLEHVVDPDRLLAEVSRVVRDNVVITVPNNTQRLSGHIAWSHMLDIDHKHFFTVETLNELLLARFESVEIRQIVAADFDIAKDLLSKWTFRMYRIARKLGLERDKLHFRLIANASKRR